MTKHAWEILNAQLYQVRFFFVKMQASCCLLINIYRHPLLDYIIILKFWTVLSMFLSGFIYLMDIRDNNILWKRMSPRMISIRVSCLCAHRCILSGCLISRLPVNLIWFELGFSQIKTVEGVLAAYTSCPVPLMEVVCSGWQFFSSSCWLT